MRCLVITNNPMVHSKAGGAHYLHGASYMEVLYAARDRVHLGHRLLSHPLAGSVKPGQTPYKSIVLSVECGERLDDQSLALIERTIATADHLIRQTAARPPLSESKLADFQLIDYSLIADAVE